jgi:DNA-binding CsgD family transcriptional regulator
VKPWDELEKVQTEKERLVEQFNKLSEREISLKRQCLKMLRKLPEDLLTRRETEVLMELQSGPGLTNKEIGARLNIAERTVKFHVTMLLDKCGVKGRRQLIEAAQLEKT